MNANEAISIFTQKAEKRGFPFLQKTDEGVEIDADPNGFPVGFFKISDDIVLVTGGHWHEHFGDFNEALNCSAFLLSDTCRLKTVYRGESVASCTVQHKIDGEWFDGPMVGFFFVPFWKPKRIEFSQNQIITEF